MIMQPEDDDKMVKIIRKRLKAKEKVPFAMAFDWLLHKYQDTNKDAPTDSAALVESCGKSMSSSDHRLAKQVLGPLFKKYDIDGSGTMQVTEIKQFMKKEFGRSLTDDEATKIATEWDLGGAPDVDLDEFVKGLFAYYIVHRDDLPVSPALLKAQQQVKRQLSNMEHEEEKAAKLAMEAGVYNSTDSSVENEGHHDEEEEDEEEDEWTQSLASKTPAERKSAILKRSFMYMGAGMVIVLLFSDPMVGVLNELGLRTGIPPFFVAFILAPLASNASELIASYNYAAKKTSVTIQVSLSQLLGAANMNNTFCLAIFLALICFRPLVWEFTAETISILLIEIIMFCYTLKTTHTLLDGVIVGLLFPASIFFVWLLEYPLNLN